MGAVSLLGFLSTFSGTCCFPTAFPWAQRLGLPEPQAQTEVDHMNSSDVAAQGPHRTRTLTPPPWSTLTPEHLQGTEAKEGAAWRCRAHVDRAQCLSIFFLGEASHPRRKHKGNKAGKPRPRREAAASVQVSLCLRVWKVSGHWQV